MPYPAIAVLRTVIRRKLEQAFHVYEQHQSRLLESSADGESRVFLAQSASVLSAGCAEIRETGKLSLLCSDNLKLSESFPKDPQLRVEHARALYYHVYALKREGRLSDAKACFRNLCDLVEQHSNETILAEMKDKAAGLLELN